MSDLLDQPNYDKTGIKTSTFYSQKKLHTFPRLIKTWPGPINDKERPNQTIKRSLNPHKFSQRPIERKKKGMSNKRDAKRKLNKSNKRNAKIRNVFSDGKANDVGNLQIGKRSSMGSVEQARRCKKIKLDINKNVVANEKPSTQSELYCKSELKSEQDSERKTEELDSQGSTICLSSSPSIYDGDLATERDVFDTRRKCENDKLCGVSSSSNACERNLGGTNQNNQVSNNSPNMKDKVLNVDQKAPISDVYETPSKFCQSENSFKKTERINVKLNGSTNINDKILRTYQKEQSDTVTESEYDIYGCRIEESLRGTDQDSATNENDNVLTNNQREPFDATKEPEYDIFGSTPTSSCQSKGRRNAKSRTPRKKMGSLDAFFTIENTRTSKTREKQKDCGFHEPFRILGELSSQEERNCSSTNTSSLLFSQNSTTSSGSGSSKTKSISPDSQSSITKYFTPLNKSTSLSPSSDKKGKRISKLRKVTLPLGSPVCNKKEQMFLDLGQKNFGHVTCPTCHMVYTRAQPEDEAYHVKFHQKVVSGLRFTGWKTERVVEHFDDGRVIVVLPQDPPSHLKKVASVRMVVDDELGFSSETSQRMQDCKTYIFIADKRVVGCVVAVVIQEITEGENRTKAFPVIPSTTNGTDSGVLEQGAWCCSSAPVRAQCGISRVWVLQQYRRKRIATRILDCVRSDFMFGGVVAKELMAFSDPTPLGKQLAESYCGTENFLVFR